MKRLPLFCWSFRPWCCLGLSWQFRFAFYGVLLRFALHFIDFPPKLFLSFIALLQAFACPSFAHQPIRAVYVLWQMGKKKAAFRFSCLLLCFSLCSVLYFICTPVFCSSADHCSVCFVVDGQKKAAFRFSGLLLRFSLCSVLSFICTPVFCSSANHCSVCFVVDGQKMAAFHFFWFITTLCLCSVLSFICTALFCQSFPSLKQQILLTNTISCSLSRLCSRLIKIQSMLAEVNLHYIQEILDSYA